MSQTFRQKYFDSRLFYKEVAAIAIPVMAQILIQSLVSLVDNFMVAELGDIKMSGVNVAGQILYLFQVLINAVCTAGGIFQHSALFVLLYGDPNAASVANGKK